MDCRLVNSETIYSSQLNQQERTLEDLLELEVENNPTTYSLEELWNYDFILGMIGAYSMPANPIKNPFKGGFARELFRPLQYARSNMDILDISLTARHAVQDTGLHLECVFKYLLSKFAPFGNIRFNNITLGKANYELAKRNCYNDSV